MENDAQDDSKPEKCWRCKGTGFDKGKICTCISGEKPELPDGLKQIFGDVFGGKR